MQDQTAVAGFERGCVTLLERLGELRGAECWVISRHTADERFQVIAATANPFGLRPGAAAPWSAAPASLMRPGSGLQTADLRHTAGARSLALVRQLDLRAYAGQPLVIDDAVVGAVCGFSRLAGRLPVGATDALSLGADLLAELLAAEQRAAEALLRAADVERPHRRDPLTGLLDRGGFAEAAEVVEGLVVRLAHRPALVTVTVDDPADTAVHGGWEEADEVIAASALALRTSVPRGAILGRLADATMGVLLPDASNTEVQQLTASLRRLMDTGDVRAQVRGMTLQAVESVADLIERADQPGTDHTADAVRATVAVRQQVTTLPDWLPGSRTASDARSAERALQQILDRTRQHLGLDVVFVGRWDGGNRVMEYVSAEQSTRDALHGLSQPLEQTYCAHVMDGTIPRVVPDVRDVPDLMELPVTASVGFRSHLGIPLHLPDGRLYGTLCALDPRPRPSLNDRDVDFLEFVAGIVAAELAALDRSHERGRVMSDTVRHLMADGHQIALQPIRSLRDSRTAGYEALSRFDDTSVTPDVWFGRAARIGMAQQLELYAIERALRLLPVLPGDRFLTLNASPEVACGIELHRMLEDVDRQRVVVEVTEQLPLGDDWVAGLARLRAAGTRIAVDDTGAGHASMQRLVELQPELIKIDRAIIDGMGRDAAKQAMVLALGHFAESMGARLIAEGIETAEDRDTASALGVSYGQGFVLGPPRLTPVPT